MKEGMRPERSRAPFAEGKNAGRPAGLQVFARSASIADDHPAGCFSESVSIF